MKKKIMTDEMVSDLSLMGDVQFSKKWGVSRRWIIQERKKLGIPSFNLQHATIPHKFVDGVECKWCPTCGQYVPCVEFRPNPKRYDGLRGVCGECERRAAREYSYSDHGKRVVAAWRQSENGRSYKRNTWRKTTAKRKNALGNWSKELEQKTYDAFAGRCAYCGVPVRFLELEFDHFIPMSAGGMTTVGNMVPSCVSCNRGVGGKFMSNPNEWLISRYGENFGTALYKTIKSTLRSLLK